MRKASAFENEKEHFLARRASAVADFVLESLKVKALVLGKGMLF
jgi:hypothetical protein